MKEQLIEMGFVETSLGDLVKYQLDYGLLWVDYNDGMVIFEEDVDRIATLTRHATIEQISNILKSIQI